MAQNRARAASTLAAARPKKAVLRMGSSRRKANVRKCEFCVKAEIMKAPFPEQKLFLAHCLDRISYNMCCMMTTCSLNSLIYIHVDVRMFSWCVRSRRLLLRLVDDLSRGRPNELNRTSGTAIFTTSKIAILSFPIFIVKLTKFSWTPVIFG